MIAFGWSVGDLAAAIQIIWHVIHAFDRAKGSKKQYAASCAFLRALVPVLERMNLQIESTEASKLQDDMLIQAEAISTAYADFEGYLDKRHGLSARRPSDVNRVVATIKWSFDELHDKVQKLQERIINSVQLFQTLIIQEIQKQVSSIASDMAASRQNGAQREELLKNVTATLAKINVQNEALEQASFDYQSSLDEQRNEQDLAARVTLAEIAEISASQKQLARSLAELTECIEKQREQAESQAEAAQWQEVAVQAEEQTSTAEQAQQRTLQELDNTKNILQGGSELGGNAQLGEAATKIQGAQRLIGAFGPVSGKLFGPKVKPAESSSPARLVWKPRDVSDHRTARMQDPRRPRRHADLLTGRRVPQPLPEIRNLPPPPARYASASNTQTVSTSPPMTTSPQPTPAKPALPPRAASVQLPLQASPPTSIPLRNMAPPERPALPPRGPPLPKLTPATKPTPAPKPATFLIAPPTATMPPPARRTSASSTTSSAPSLALSPTSTNATSSPPRTPPRSFAVPSPLTTKDTTAPSSVRDLRNRFEGVALMGVRSA